MGEQAEGNGRVDPARTDARRPRPRPRPAPRVLAVERRLGRFFAAGQSEPDAIAPLVPPDYFPGVPRLEGDLADSESAAPRPRPRPENADRPRPGTRG